MTEKKVLILTSDTGGGHTSAARALEAGLGVAASSATYLVHIAKAMEENGAITERLGSVYNYLLRNRQQYVKYYHWAINRFRPDRWDMVYRFGKHYGRQLVGKFGPNVIVSVHPMMQAFFARLLKELDLTEKIPLVTVVTDPFGNSWRGWADDGVKLYVVAHEEAQRELESYGVSPERIRVCGMPIHPKFEEVARTPETRTRVLSELGLESDRFTILVNAGWVGGGNIPELFDSLVSATLPVQAIFVAGRNEGLRRHAEERAASANFPVRVVGYTDHMDRLMGAANIMVSKLGGLTTFEALACRLPIIGDAVTRPMPQEERTAQMLERKGAAVMVHSVRDVVPAIERLVRDESAYRGLREAAGSLGTPDATKRIIREIERLVPAGIPLIGEPLIAPTAPDSHRLAAAKQVHVLLENKIALVSGGSRGLGRAMCEVFAREGADVAFNYQSNDKLAAEVVSAIESHGRRALAYRVSVTDRPACNKMVREILEKFERIDILVNNAAINRADSFATMTERAWTEVMDVNVNGLFNVTKPVYKQMLRRRGGKILNITSIGAVRALPTSVHYATSKAAVLGFTKCLSREASQFGISVNAIAAGIFDTDLGNTLPEKFLEIYTAWSSSGRLGRAEELAEFAAFMCSDRNSYMNGEIITIDGGSVT